MIYGPQKAAILDLGSTDFSQKEVSEIDVQIYENDRSVFDKIVDFQIAGCPCTVEGHLRPFICEIA